MSRIHLLGRVAAIAVIALYCAQMNAQSLHSSANLDWSQRVVDATMTRNPNPATFGPWGYQRGFYLLGQWEVYQQTHDPRYLAHIQGWVDAHIDAKGRLDHKIDALDYIQAANLAVILYQETHEERYRQAADSFRSSFDDWPRTSDGGFWHAEVPSRHWQLWLDGTYMSLPFLLRYGQVFHDSHYADREAVWQLLIYYKHLKAARTGLLFHAYDESGKSAWVVPGTHHSCCFWGRSIGWYGMTLVDTLDVIPRNQPGRAKLIRILRRLVQSLAKYQDPKTGLWYQVVNQGDLASNWTETSASSMFTYIIDVSVKRGYVSNKYHEVAEKGYQGVLTRVSLNANGLTEVKGICVGTNVGNLQFYLNRPRKTNDFHGLGAFLIMNEEWNTGMTPFHHSTH